MAKLQLSLDTLGELDRGAARLLIDREIQRAVADLEDRGEEDGKARKVNISLEMVVKDGLAVVQLNCESKLPSYRSNLTAGNIKVNAGKPVLYFQPYSPDNADQPNFQVLDADAGD